MFFFCFAWSVCGISKVVLIVVLVMVRCSSWFVLCSRVSSSKNRTKWHFVLYLPLCQNLHYVRYVLGLHQYMIF